MSVVNNRMSDIKISVREAAVELVGTYILEKENFIDQYLESVVSRLDDPGLSVRKRYGLNSSHFFFSYTFYKMQSC